MISFARRHPAVTTLGLGVFIVIAGGIYRSALGGGLILLWCALVVFFAAHWLRRRFKPKAPAYPPGYLDVPTSPPDWPRASAPMVQALTAFAAPSLGDVLTLTAAQFEDLCRDLLTACGFQSMTRCGGAGDLGADVKGRDRQGRSVIVQAKRYAPGNQVGSPVLQSFIGMMTVQHKAERGVFVTSAAFSLPAVNLAKAHGVTLIDGPTLLTLMALTGVGCNSVAAAPVQTFMLSNTPSIMTASRAVAAEFIPGGSAVSHNGSGFVAAPRAANYCIACGARVEPGAGFCAECGAVVKRADDARVKPSVVA